jgi:hypothetical protein
VQGVIFTFIVLTMSFPIVHATRIGIGKALIANKHFFAAFKIISSCISLLCCFFVENEMSDQQEHDLQLHQALKSRKLLQPGSRQQLEALLAKKSGNSSGSEPSSGQGPIEWALTNYPQLSRETAEQMAAEFGF